MLTHIPSALIALPHHQQAKMYEDSPFMATASDLGALAAGSAANSAGESLLGAGGKALESLRAA